tara:strand:+ start:2793 stop:4412 length:1620 start_codon:yes stop_codon:yes gene_type:complete
MGIADKVKNLVRRKTPVPNEKEIFNLGIQERRHPQHMAGPVLYDTAKNSTIVRSCMVQLKTEIFRRSYQWSKAFELKCTDCGYEHQKLVDDCMNCESINLRKPSFKQKNYAENFFNGYVNDAHQMFIDVLKELETDLNIIDDCYLVLVKDYYLDDKGDIVLSKINEIYRGDPVTIFIETDEHGDRGYTRFTCITHREFSSTDVFDKCGECSGKLHPIEFVNKVNGIDQNYIVGEVIHQSKYSPTRLYGHPPVITLWNNIFTLAAMESYVSTSYSKARTPRGILAVQTNNMESLIKYWKGVKEKLEKDPHYIPIMGIETDGGSKGSVEWIPFMNTLKEMDYIAVKEDLRDRICAFYGVSKIFMADSAASGGLNNEGMQILVTNRAVEMAQNVYNKYMFPFLMKQFGITDWKLQLLRSEEEDNLARLRRREIEINMATQIKNLGFEVDMDEEGKFTYKKFPPKQEINVDMGEPSGEGEDKKLELDPYAGTNVDASQMGQMQEEMLTRNKPSMSVGPPQRNSGLPAQAANNNVDKRTERRVG